MSENILAQFLRSEKDLRPYWETDHRGMVLPLIKSGYNNSVSYGLPGILGGSAPSVLNDILQGRMVDKGEIEQGATDAAGAAMTGSLAFTRPMGAIPSGTSRPTGHSSSAPLPTEQLAARLGDGQQGHTAFASSQPAQGSHTNWLNDPSLAEIASRYGLQKDGALAEPIARVLADPGNFEYGIRTTPYEIKPGSIMPDSTQWYQDANPVPWKTLTRDERDIVKDHALGSMSIDEIKARNWDPNYLDHGDPLGGASTAGLIRQNRDIAPSHIDAARAYKSYGSDGDFVHLVRSRRGRDGLDDGERILQDAEVIASAPFGNNLFANAPTSAAAPSLQHIAQAAAREQAPGIRAYHGSPHDFDKFDISKIGTGEGAQAYGHGLYFAENEGVAKSYRDALKKDNPNKLSSGTDRFKHLEIDGKPIGQQFDIDAAYVDEFKSRIAAGEEIRPLLSEKLSRWQQMAADGTYPFPQYAKDKIAAYQGLIDRINAGGQVRDAGAGRMYEVNIKADPNDFLDWDKPLSQQSEKVRGDLAKLGIRDEIGEKKTPPSITGWEYADSNIYLGDSVANDQGTALLRRIGGDHAGHPEVSQKLRDAGIPGIKYLDQGSRVNGEGSRNYVVFSDKDIEIIRKYGLAAFLAMGGAAASQPPTNDGPRNVLAGPF